MPVISSDSAAVGPKRPAPSRVRAGLELLRPANAVTAAADVLAGVAVAQQFGGVLSIGSGIMLACAGILLYAGGVALNDACDAGIDRAERPERPIPSGRFSRAGAFAVAATLLALGIASAAAVGMAPGLVACAIVCLVLLYDFWAKHRAWLGPLAMGSCRAGSLLLGVSSSTEALATAWWVGALPLAYVAAITLVSRGESDGRNPSGGWALAFLCAVIVALAALATSFGQLIAFVFIAGFGVGVLPAFWRAWTRPDSAVIRAAVRTGVLSLVPMGASLAAAFAGWPWGLAVLLLFPVSRTLARVFPVA